MGEVAVAGNDAGVGDESQERDDTRREVERKEETRCDGDDDGGKREADAIDGEGQGAARFARRPTIHSAR